MTQKHLIQRAIASVHLDPKFVNTKPTPASSPCLCKDLNGVERKDD
jgi:hypothetical protein